MRIRINDLDVHYEWSGNHDGPVVALCHSLGTSVELWDRQLPALSQHFRVLRYDVRGHGSTEVTSGDYSIEQLALDFLGLLDALGVERTHFCGVSLGGLIGQWLGARAPERVERIVLANTAAQLGTRDTWDARIEVVRERGMAPIAGGAIERWFTNEFATREPGVTASFRQRLLATSVDGYAGCCAAIRDADHRSLVSEIRRPVLVVAGKMDRVTTPEDAARLADGIRGASVIALPAAHLANVEASEPFNDAVMAFLS